MLKKEKQHLELLGNSEILFYMIILLSLFLNLHLLSTTSSSLSVGPSYGSSNAGKIRE